MTIRELRKLPSSIATCLSALHQTFEKQLVFTSSLSKEDQVIAHMIAIEMLSIRIITLDTGRHFPEYYDLWQRTENKLGITIHAYYPDNSEVERFVKSKGINGFYESFEARKLCCAIRKVNPLKRALAGKKIWITGLRKEQSEGRENVQRFQTDGNIIKYNPLIDWSEEQLDEYINLHNIPINPLHKKGFHSIGCAPCTRAIEPHEHPRAGRWWWESSKKECGLHTNN